MQLRTLNLLAAAVSAVFVTAAVAQTSTDQGNASRSRDMTAPETQSGSPGSSRDNATGSPGSTGRATGGSPGASGHMSGRGTGSSDFTSLDKDRDGYISRSEATQGGLSQSFTSLDKNGDGKLDRSEFSGASSGMGGTSGSEGMTSGSRSGSKHDSSSQ